MEVTPVSAVIWMMAPVPITLPAPNITALNKKNEKAKPKPVVEIKQRKVMVPMKMPKMLPKGTGEL